jgi:hypothetical protein
VPGAEAHQLRVIVARNSAGLTAAATFAQQRLLGWRDRASAAFASEAKQRDIDTTMGKAALRAARGLTRAST